MNKIIGVLILTLFFLSSVEAKQAKVKKINNSGDAMSQQYREGMSKRLTSQEREIVLNTLFEALKVIDKEKELTEVASPFGEYFHVEPKSGGVKVKDYKTYIAATSFSRKSEVSDWNYITVSLKINNFTIIDFTQKDFDFLDLSFEKIEESTYKAVKTPSGKKLESLMDLPCYKYQFRLKRNNNIRVVFRVFPEMMNKNESFPRNFKLVSIYKDE